MASSSSSTTKKITLKSSVNEIFEIEEAVALESQLIKHMIDDDVTIDAGIPIQNITGKILAKVIEYCKKHVDAASSNKKPSEDELNKWDAEFIEVDKATLFNLILAANYLDIKSLLELTCKTLADMIKGKTPEEIRNNFNIVNDYSPEEEDEVHRENKWVFC